MIGLAIIIVGAIVLYKVGPPLIRSFLNWCSKSPECTLYIPAQQHQPPVRFEPVQPTLVFPATDPYVYVAQQQPYSMPVANAVGNRVPSPSTNHGIFVRPSLAPANAGARVSGGPQPGQYNHNGT